MRRFATTIALILALAMPAAALAQGGPYNDKQNPNEYTNAEDGQPLKFFSYFLAPVGYALEWGVMRPLHYLATKTPLAPALSGDTEYSEINNPGPAVAPMQPLMPADIPAATAPKAQNQSAAGPAVMPAVPHTQVAPANPGGQPVLH
jgi:hypothetical protein